MTLIHAIILAGGRRPSPLAERLGMPVPCVPLGAPGAPGRTLLGLWRRALAELAEDLSREREPAACRVDVVVSRPEDMADVEATLAADETGPLEPCVRMESSRWRGTGGMVRDLIHSTDARALDTGALEAILVIEGGAVPTAGLRCVIQPLLGRGPFELRDRRADAVVAVGADDVPAGFVAFRPSALDLVPGEGFHDIKEQWLPALHREGRGAVAVHLPRALPRVRTVASYLAASRRQCRGEACIHPSARVDAAARIRGACLIGADVVVEAEAVVQDAALLEGCRVETGAIVARAIVAPGSVVGDGMIWRDVVVRTAGRRPRPGPEVGRAEGPAPHVQSPVAATNLGRHNSSTATATATAAGAGRTQP